MFGESRASGLLQVCWVGVGPARVVFRYPRGHPRTALAARKEGSVACQNTPVTKGLQSTRKLAETVFDVFARMLSNDPHMEKQGFP